MGLPKPLFRVINQRYRVGIGQKCLDFGRVLRMIDLEFLVAEQLDAELVNAIG